jgi:hypothetical protein
LGDIGTTTIGSLTLAFSGISHGYGYANVHAMLFCYDDSAYTTRNNTCDSSDLTHLDFMVGDKHLIYFDFGGFTTTNGKYYQIYYYNTNNYTTGSSNPESYIWGDTSYNPYYYLVADTNIGTTTPPVSTSTPNFASILVSTSTSKVNLTGYWESGN